jgi:hypothetical protein
VPTPRDLAADLARVLETERPLLLAVPDGPATSAPNRPSGKGWSMREEPGHLVDSAVNNHLRIAGAALHDSFEGPDYDQEGWVAVHGYAGIPWPDLVGIWHAHNAILLPLVGNLPHGRLAVPCSVGGGAPVALGVLLGDYVLHMRHHLDQVLRREKVTPYP